MLDSGSGPGHGVFDVQLARRGAGRHRGKTPAPHEVFWVFLGVRDALVTSEGTLQQDRDAKPTELEDDRMRMAIERRDRGPIRNQYH